MKFGLNQQVSWYRCWRLDNSPLAVMSLACVHVLVGSTQETSAEELIMKELPSHLKYEFLEPEKRKPVIIAVALMESEEKKLLEILRKYMEAIAWSIEDLKGICPSICMHKILLNDNAKTSIEHERRLNPVMKEVVRKEVLK